MTSSVAVLLLLVAAASALPQFQQIARSPQTVPQVVFRSHQLDEAGQFSSSFQGSDGTYHQETGVLKPTADGKGYALEYKGKYGYTDTNGKFVEVSYTAGKDGFKPESSVIPVAPANIPPTF